MSYDAKALNRVKRIEGQLRMTEEGKDCKEVITQLSAARSRRLYNRCDCK